MMVVNFVAILLHCSFGNLSLVPRVSRMFPKKTNYIRPTCVYIVAFCLTAFMQDIAYVIDNFALLQPNMKDDQLI